MAVLLVVDILRIFNMYEPSRIRTWEIVRSLHPAHCAALIYLLENIGKTRKINAYNASEMIEEPEEILEDCSTSTVTFFYAFAEVIHVKLNRAEKVIDNLPLLLPLNLSKVVDITDARDDNGRLTIFGMLQMIRDKFNFDGHRKRTSRGASCPQECIFESLNYQERIVAHNLCTYDYARFASNVMYHLLPDEMQRDRNKIGRFEVETSVTKNFLQFYESIASLNHQREGYYGNSDPNSFRYMLRPRNRILLEPLEISRSGEYIHQPYYRGLRTIINATESETRCYNKYGELLHGFMYGERFHCHATFEAIIMPLDEAGTVRSWRYNPRPKWVRIIEDLEVRDPCDEIKTKKKKVERINFILIVVDVLRFGKNILYDVPFEKRLKFIERIRGPRVRYALSSKKCRDPYVLEKEYRSRIDPFDPIIGSIYRHRNSLCNEMPYEYRFNSTTYYDFFSNSFVSPPVEVDRFMTDRDSLSNIDGVFVDPEIVSDYRTVCIVYAHNDDSYFVCKFDRCQFRFAHAGTLSRSTDISRTKPRYKPERIYVYEAKAIPMGVLLLRVYYNKNENEQHLQQFNTYKTQCGSKPERLSKYSIVAFEEKLTVSMYDVPYNDQLLLP